MPNSGTKPTKRPLDSCATPRSSELKERSSYVRTVLCLCTTASQLSYSFDCRHGRVAMFAFVGYLVHANGIKWPWPMMLDGTPFPDETNPPLLWDKIPDNAKWQIFGLIFFLELWSEISNDKHKHYMRGGKPGDFPNFDVEELPHPVPFNFFDPFGLSKNKSEEKKARGLVVEINNGRLAMLGIFGYV